VGSGPALRAAAAPLAGVALAAALLLASADLGAVAAPGQLSPAFWPRLVLAGLGLACLAKAAEAVRQGRSRAEAAARAPVGRGALAGGVGLIVLYVLLTPWLGFALVTALFIAAFMLLCGARGPLAIGLHAVLGTVGLLYLFVKLVYLPLPKGAGPFEDLTIGLLRALGIF
jgi:putative tricarboxylic transport membrane protein